LRRTPILPFTGTLVLAPAARDGQAVIQNEGGTDEGDEGMRDILLRGAQLLSPGP
jgi:hypothetical protein